MFLFFFILASEILFTNKLCLQCFDAVGWAAGRASGLSGEVLAWLSVWSEVQLHMVQLMPLPPHHLLLQ